MPETYDEIVDRVNALELAIENAGSEEERSVALDNLFGYAEILLDEPGHGWDHTAFLRVWQNTAGTRHEARFWNWLKPFACTPNDDRRITIRIAILELLPEEPPHWHALEVLFLDWWFDDRTRWAAFAAYELHPGLFMPHFDRFVGKAKEQGRQYPGLDKTEYESWFKTVRDCEDDGEWSAEDNALWQEFQSWWLKAVQDSGDGN